MLLDGLGSYPPYFLRLREVNRRGPGRLRAGAAGAWRRLDVGEVRRLTDAAALIVDVRPIAAFAAGHIPGSLSIPLRDQFATWLGWLVEARSGRSSSSSTADQDRAEVVRQALKIGYERLAGELAGGMAAWEAAGLASRADPARARRRGGRRRSWTSARTPSSPPGTSPARCTSSSARSPRPAVAAAGPLTLMCGHGERAMTAASILAAAGHRDLAVAVGGPADWAAATGRTLETGR